MIYFVSDPIFKAHKTGPWHPERPARVEMIDQALIATKLKTPANTLPLRFATEDEILLCHTKAYFDLVKQEIKNITDPDTTVSLSTGDAVICQKSFEASLLAVGGVLAAIDQVMNEPGTKAFCAVRPPGHHACSSAGMGFCLFNNVAVGARYAQLMYKIERVLIVDWDVHHGNGTQEIFYQDPSVFYFSTHEKDFYPFTGLADEIGEGLGKGYTLNCPIAAGLGSRSKVIEAFETQLREKMKIFRPELVIISAGFDAHASDPLGHFNLTDDDFSTLTCIVKEIANEYAQGRLVSVLEGGYDLRALATAVVQHIAAM